MAMSRKHYNAAAATILNQRGRVPLAELLAWDSAGSYNSEYEMDEYGAGIAAYRIAEGLADMFASDNPKFDRNKFMEACGF